MGGMFAWLTQTLYQVLRRSETFTKTDMVYMAGGGFWLTLAKGVGMVVSLLVATAMANLIDPTTFGIYRFVLAGAGIIAAFSLTGMGTMIVQAVARGNEGALMAGMRSYLRWSLIPVIISLGVALYYLIQGNTVLASGFFLVAVFNTLVTAYSFFSQFISGKKDFRTQSLFDSIADILPGIVLVVALFYVQDVISLLFVYFVSTLLTNVILHYVTIRKYRPNDVTDPEMLPFVKHLSFMGVLGKVGENIDKILVFHYLGAAPLAMYAFAQMPIAQLKLLVDIPVKVALPKLSERNFSELKLSLPRKTFLLMLGMLVVALVYAFAAPILFRIFFPAYIDAVIYTQILALSIVFTPSTMFAAALTAHMKKHELYISQAILPALKIVLFLLLLPIWGIWGAIAVTIIHQAITFAVFGYLFMRARDDTRKAL